MQLPPGAPPPDLRLLVPVIRAQPAANVLRVSDALLTHRRGSGQLLALVEVAQQGSSDPRLQVTRRRHDLLRWIAETDRIRDLGQKGALSVVLRVAHRVTQGIREAVYENDSNLLVQEWPGPTSRRRGLLEAVLEDLVANPPADLLLVRPDMSGEESGGRWERILVPVRGGANASLAVQAAVAMAEANGSELTLMHVYHPRHSPDRRAAEAALFREIVRGVGYPRLQVVERESDRAGRVIVQEAASHQAVILGALADPPGSSALVTSQLATTIRSIRGTVILAKAVRWGPGPA
jgi:nucleotide-binding universal stress UspA family protein